MTIDANALVRPVTTSSMAVVRPMGPAGSDVSPVHHPDRYPPARRACACRRFRGRRAASYIHPCMHASRPYFTHSAVVDPVAGVRGGRGVALPTWARPWRPATGRMRVLGRRMSTRSEDRRSPVRYGVGVWSGWGTGTSWRFRCGPAAVLCSIGQEFWGWEEAQVRSGRQVIRVLGLRARLLRLSPPLLQRIGMNSLDGALWRWQCARC